MWLLGGALELNLWTNKGGNESQKSVLSCWSYRKQYQSSSQKIGQICDIETVEPPEIPFKVCAIFYNSLSD